MFREIHPLDIAEIARHEEAREARTLAEVADVAEPIAGGQMCFAGKSSHANQAMGLGMNGPVDPATIQRLITFYESRGVEPRIELCPLADESLIRGLADQQFVVRDFETVLACDLEHTTLPPAPEVTVQRVNPTDEQQIQRYTDIAIQGFSVEVTEPFRRTVRRALLHPENRTFAAVIDDQWAGVGSCQLSVPCAAMSGMTTLEQFRRRGCQHALMIARLESAKRAGCRYVCIHSKPHVATARNAMRLGFQVVYTKAILVRPGPGLVPSP